MAVTAWRAPPMSPANKEGRPVSFTRHKPDRRPPIPHWAWAQIQQQFGDGAKDFNPRQRTQAIAGGWAHWTVAARWGNALLDEMMRPSGLGDGGRARKCWPASADWVAGPARPVCRTAPLWRARTAANTVLARRSLYGRCVSLVRYGLYTHDKRFGRRLPRAINHHPGGGGGEQDSDGIWFHGYFERQQESRALQNGRAGGNGWVTVTLAETLSAMPNNDPPAPSADRHPAQTSRRHQAVCRPPPGMWRQVLDRPELWEEDLSHRHVSPMASARAVNRGWLPASDMAIGAARPLPAVAKNVTPDGAVQNTCCRHPISATTLEFYIT